MKRIAVLIDTIDNNVAPSGLELISFAEEFARSFSLDIQIIIAGEHVEKTARTAALQGHDIIGIEDASLLHPNPEYLARAMASLTDDGKPHYICFQHTMRGCQMAAYLSVLLDATCITAIESFRAAGEEPVFTRSLFNGKIKMDLASAGRSVLTVLPGAFAVTGYQADRKPGNVTIMPAPAVDSPSTPLGISKSPEETIRLEDSDVIVSAGRGIGAPENLELIRAVAKLIPNSAIGASRIICDQKWLPYAHQVGVTGKTVSPKLYMACGISGAQQHIAGMKGSQLIVAINTDPQASIVSISDYIVIEDLRTFLPLLVRKYEEMYL